MTIAKLSSMCVLALGFSLTCVACGDDDDGGGGEAPEWQGSTPHAALDGQGGGETVTVDVSGAAAADTANVACALEYHMGPLIEVELTVHVVENGVEKEYQIELQGRDFATLAAGTTLDVVAPVEDDALAPDGQVHVEVQWEWEEGGELVAYEKNAVSGTVYFGELVGEADATGVIPSGTGRLGAAVDVTMDDGETLRASFSANCSETEVE
jgi:hypothetical protein